MNLDQKSESVLFLARWPNGESAELSLRNLCLLRDKQNASNLHELTCDASNQMPNGESAKLPPWNLHLLCAIKTSCICGALAQRLHKEGATLSMEFTSIA